MTRRTGLWIALGVASVPVVLVLGFVLEQIRSVALGERHSGKGFGFGAWDAPAFQGTDQEDRTVSDRTLRGHPWIASFIYTRCTSACPMITAKVRLIERRVARTDIRFVSFSVDPDFDTSAVLRAYAASWGPPDPRWILVSAAHSTVERLAAALKAPVEPSGDPENPIFHTNSLFLIDKSGSVLGAYDSTDAASIDRLVLDAEGAEPAPKAPSRVAADDRSSGSELFKTLGCSGCHADRRIAPSLVGLHDRDVRLDDGRSVHANSLYIEDSILRPSRQIVAGYGPIMPSYEGIVTEGQIERLVSFIESSSGAENESSPPPGSPATDPVCGMKVPIDSHTAHATYRGHDYFFCSEPCRERFVAAPEKFVPSG